MSTPGGNDWLDIARRVLANISPEQPSRIPDVTCQVCTKPVIGYRRCYHCNAHRSSPHVEHFADLVVPLAYAWEGQTQLGKDVYRYKRDQGDIAATAIGNLAALVYAFNAVHWQCPGRLLGRPVTAKAVMPSLRANPGTALRLMSERFLPNWPVISVSAAGNYGDGGRSLDSSHFQVDHSSPVLGAHVLVLEDTWVTGAYSQSIAVALKQAGAVAVTMLPICVLLDPAWQPNAAYSQSSYRRLWSPDICPVTGSTCPWWSRPLVRRG